MLETILKKLSIEEIGKHLSNYANLYIKPVETWKKATDLRTSSYDFVILHIVYFTILILLVVKDVYLAIPICLMEVILTLFPFFVFIIPYKISFIAFNKKTNWKRLFRLFIIIKLQTLPTFFLLFKFAEYSKSEEVYLLIDNFLLLLWIFFIIVFPLISNLKYYQKLIWIFFNYISFVGLILTSYIIFSQTNILGKFGEDLMLLTPGREYLNNESKLTNQFRFIDDSYYILIGKESEPNVVTYDSTIFADLRLCQLFNIKVRNNLIKRIIYNDSVICTLNKSRVSKKDSLQSLYEKNELNIRVLDSFKLVLFKDFQHDLILTDSLSKYAKFESNRDYYNKLNLYLDDYCRSYFNSEEMYRIHKYTNHKTILKLENNTYVTLLNIDKKFYDQTKILYLQSKEKLELRDEKMNFIASIFFYPIDKLFEMLDYHP